MIKKQKLTPVEWEIMEALWALGGSPSIREVLDSKYITGDKAYTTVQTTMNILVSKGMLTRRKIGLVNFYAPTQPRRSLVKNEVATMISRIFNGSAPALTNYLIDSENLSLEEIGTIKALLDSKEKQLQKSGNG